METFLTDSGPLVALLNHRDEHHEWARAFAGTAGQCINERQKRRISGHAKIHRHNLPGNDHSVFSVLQPIRRQLLVRSGVTRVPRILQHEKHAQTCTGQQREHRTGENSLHACFASYNRQDGFDSTEYCASGAAPLRRVDATLHERTKADFL